MLAALTYSLADAVVRTLPAPWTDGLARLLGRAVFAAHVPARARLERNLSRLVPADAARVRGLARETFEQFALTVADFLRLAHASAAEVASRVVVMGDDPVERARHDARGCVLLSVHSGCWEWAVAYLAARGIRLRVLSRPHDSASIERFFRARRGRWGIRTLERSPLWLEASRALKRGEWVALMGDREVPGLHGSLCAWAQLLARRNDAALVPIGTCRLADGRHALWCDPPLDARLEIQAPLRRALRRHLERAPGQWFGFAPLADGLA